MPKGILTQFSFQNAQGYPHQVFLSKCTRVSSHSVPFKILLGYSLGRKSGPVCFSKCPRVSSLSFLVETPKGINMFPYMLVLIIIIIIMLTPLTHFPCPSGSVCFSKCPRVSSLSFLVETPKGILTQFAFIIFGVDAGIIFNVFTEHIDLP